MWNGKAKHSCSKGSFREPGTRTHTLLLSPGVCRGGLEASPPHSRGSLHPSPPPRSKRQGKNHEQQSSANERPSRCRGAGITAAGQRFCWRLGRRPGEQPAGGGTTLTGFQRPPRTDAQAFLSLYGSDQIKTNLKNCSSWWWSHWYVQSAVTPTTYLKKGWCLLLSVNYLNKVDIKII